MKIRIKQLCFLSTLLLTACNTKHAVIAGVVTTGIGYGGYYLYDNQYVEKSFNYDFDMTLTATKHVMDDLGFTYQQKGDGHNITIDCNRINNDTNTIHIIELSPGKTKVRIKSRPFLNNNETDILALIDDKLL